MARQYECPKCKSKEMYFTKKQEITGLGGIYGQRARMVLRPFCQNCDIEGNPVGQNPADYKKVWKTYLTISGVVLFLLFLLMLVL